MNGYIHIYFSITTSSPSLSLLSCSRALQHFISICFMLLLPFFFFFRFVFLRCYAFLFFHYFYADVFHYFCRHVIPPITICHTIKMTYQRLLLSNGTALPLTPQNIHTVTTRHAVIRHCRYLLLRHAYHVSQSPSSSRSRSFIPRNIVGFRHIIYRRRMRLSPPPSARSLFYEIH